MNYFIDNLAIYLVFDIFFAVSVFIYKHRIRKKYILTPPPPISVAYQIHSTVFTFD